MKGSTKCFGWAAANLLFSLFCAFAPGTYWVSVVTTVGCVVSGIAMIVLGFFWRERIEHKCST